MPPYFDCYIEGSNQGSVYVICICTLHVRSYFNERIWVNNVLNDVTLIICLGESPSSSASDVDNLNNQAMADKASLSKGIGAHGVNHVIVTQNHPNFVRLLDFVSRFLFTKRISIYGLA